MIKNSPDMLMQYGLPALGVMVLGMLAFYVLGNRGKVSPRRMARVTNRRVSGSPRVGDAMSLRRKGQTGNIPFLHKALSGFNSMASLQEKILRAGMTTSSEMFLTVCAGLAVFAFLAVVIAKKPPVLGIFAGLFFGLIIPRMVLNFRANRRLKKFLTLFPDAIDFIVRGLRSGLPVTESMNMVGDEMEEPVGSIFAGVGEQVRLGVSLEKALADTGKKLNSTEFNFFSTSIILQRETGGNLSEILNNLSDVLRKRYMMRMKIKAMSSEAKATAMIVGSLPFIVVLALSFVAPHYLVPLWTERAGNIAACCAIMSLTTGVTIMMKMAKFEI